MIQKNIALIVMLLFVGTLFFPLTVGNEIEQHSVQTAITYETLGKASNLMLHTKKMTITSNDLPDLKIVLNITSEPTYWRIRTIIYNNGTATIPAGTPIVWKIEVNAKSLYWVKVTPFYPFEPNTSIKGLPESQVIKFNKFRWRGHEIKIIVDPPYEEDYPWIELDPDPVYGLIIESNEDNNYDSYVFPKLFSFLITRTMKQIKNCLFYMYD